MAPMKVMKAKAKAKGTAKPKAMKVMKVMKATAMKVMKVMKAKATAMKATAMKATAMKGKAKAKVLAKAKAKAKLPRRSLEGLTTLLLSMERRPDRRARVEALLAKEVPVLKAEYFRASDGRADPIPDAEVAKTWNTMTNSLYGSYEDVKDKEGKIIYTAAQFADPGVDYEFSPGERGCAHSHYRMWQRAAASEAPTLILEDDVQIIFKRTNGRKATGKSFTDRLQLGMAAAEKAGADVLYLGWSGHRDGNYRYHKQKPGKRDPLIRRVEYVWTTVAYVLWPQGAKKLLEKAQPMNQPVDNFMAWEAREHRLESYVLLDEGDAKDTWAGGIVTQEDFNGDSDIKKSDGGDQGDDPTAFLAQK